MKPEFYRHISVRGVEFPLFVVRVAAGFPSPADDYIENTLDLNDYLIEHPAATFFVRVAGDSMTGAGINSGDILIVDRALTPRNGSIVVAILDGEFTVKRFSRLKGRIFLLPENPSYEPIEITEGAEFEVWGVVAHVIHTVR
ncbi:MAG TPA: translesion error-prone DNA polymerase V autoproteolytic subunit [Spirochaetota bacterium]|mgnify:CR=1 FL=1|nr:translesion error-prone DNA polymerase V autoproteolytic subunit [Spirochaetota bacterium]HPJ34888.1 translesion error-prone DNA polymerase V autoproteolytic subunit [Spirochaetota bacterium]